MLIDKNKYPLVDAVIAQMSRIKNIQAAIYVLGWDQEVNMPRGGIQHRSEQIASLEKVMHDILTGDESARLAEKIRNFRCETGPHERKILELFLEEHDKALRLPGEFVERLTRLRIVSLANWKNALDNDDYSLFKSDFDNLVKLKREESFYLDPSLSAYDAQLDKYEKGVDTRQLDPVFEALKVFTIEKLDYIGRAGASPHLFKNHYFSPKKQFRLARKISAKMGLDYHMARLDRSFHPFSIAFSPKDVRITTRINKSNPFVCLMSTIHETGHALYEQGINASLHTTFACCEASVALHESQSLLWENMVAKSFSFCEWLLPELASHFPEAYGKTDSYGLFRQINNIGHSSIRVDSDELTYNNHIILRYEIERELLSGRISAKDLPGIWEAKSSELLGHTPSSLGEGCLQDIHWAFGEFGYFPSYTLGKIFAASIMKKIEEEKPHIRHSVSQGEFSEIRLWTKDHIHKFGRLRTSREIMEEITGSHINPADFIEHINEKISILNAAKEKAVI